LTFAAVVVWLFAVGTSTTVREVQALLSVQSISRKLFRSFERSGTSLGAVSDAEMTTAVMLSTGMEIQLRHLATEHAVAIHNCMLKRDKAGPTGHGIRPLQELSEFRFTSEMCDAEINRRQPPGASFLVGVYCLSNRAGSQPGYSFQNV